MTKREKIPVKYNKNLFKRPGFFSLSPCGSGLGRGGITTRGIERPFKALANTPLPSPPPQGERGKIQNRRELKRSSLTT